MDNTGVEQPIKVRCETCRGKGWFYVGDSEGEESCDACNGFGFTKEVFCLKPAPKSLREQLEGQETNG